ncbi:hypothetical protein CMV_023942 [Castanea mollissima]|uniref:Uncharacterized protein n=1 Tax=Castanea mollissima TaxID=60419 RepID=A0A8J4VIG1_9ROSI|nr:hypothetical protein CMV_023942 [Castanea mollissima]
MHSAANLSIIAWIPLQKLQRIRKKWDIRKDGNLKIQQQDNSVQLSALIGDSNELNFSCAVPLDHKALESLRKIVSYEQQSSNKSKSLSFSFPSFH